MAGERAPRRWRLWAGGAAALVLAAGGGGLVSKIVAGGPASAAARTVPTGTAAVVRTSLSTTTQVAGTLGYAGSFQVTNELSGSALTALPPLGRVVRRGQGLYEVDGTRVPLFYGARPMWRPVQAGITPGRDVYQLDQNLIALGYTDYGYLTPSDTFTAATAAAISAWQEATGQTPTGVVQLGQVVFEPGPVRVDALIAAIGSPVQPGTAILTATSTRRSVDVQLPVTQEYLVRRGDPVTITLPDGTTTTPGVIAAVAPVATAAPGTGSGSTQASPGSGNSSSSSSSSGGSGTTGDTVDVTVRLIHPAAAGRYDQAPVEVNILDASASNVLAVPINALVALVGGGYAVEVVDGSRRSLVAVRTGLFADTLVQVSGAGLSAGMRVEVPSS
jgi:peptidoglycan hydrolase-like protein with peptidoglycan-binding domain